MVLHVDLLCRARMEGPLGTLDGADAARMGSNTDAAKGRVECLILASSLVEMCCAGVHL